MMMKSKIQHIVLCCLMMVISLAAQGQERKVQNRPYTDLRPLHFGVLLGAHLQDIEFENAGWQVVTPEEGGTVAEEIITCDADQWSPGFNVGVMADLRLNKYFSLRFTPMLHFGAKHIKFYRPAAGADMEGYVQPNTVQEMKNTYLALPLNVKFASERMNNHRPYIMAGIDPVLNLNSKNQEYLRLNKTDVFLEVGLGWECYLPFFKFAPELKFCYGLTNSLDTKNINGLRDPNMHPFTRSVKSAHSKMFVLTFYFE